MEGAAGISKLTVESAEYGGEARLEWAGDDAYLAQADVELNGGDWAEVRFRHADANNYYAVRLGADTGGGTGPVELIQCVRGKRSVKAGDTYSTASSPFSVKIKVTGGIRPTSGSRVPRSSRPRVYQPWPPVAWPWRAKKPSSRL
jgi:hypothetical protein